MMADAAFADMHADLFQVFGRDAFVQRGADAAVPVVVVLDQGVQRYGSNGEVVATVDVVSFQALEWVPQGGDLVTIGAGWSKRVDTLQDNDGFVSTAVMHG